MNEFERLLHQGKRRMSQFFKQVGQKPGESQRPDIKMCPVCGRFVPSNARDCEYCSSQLNAKPQPTVNLDTKPLTAEKANPVVILFGVFVIFQLFAIAVSTKMADYEPGLMFSPHGEVLFKLGSNYNQATLRGGEFWRTCTYMFLHGDFIHLFFNISVLAQLGPITYQNFGRRRFWLISLLAGMGGGLLSALPALVNMSGNSVGFSGALFGYIGINYIFFSRNGHRSIADRLKAYMIWGNIICIALTITGIFRIDNLAHIGGMLTGLGLGLLFDSRAYRFVHPAVEKIMLAGCFSVWGYGVYRIVIYLLTG